MIFYYKPTPDPLYKCAQSAPSQAEQNLGRLSNDLEGGKLNQPLSIDNGKLKLIATYSSEYATDWKITKTKTLNFQLALVRAAGTEDVLVYVEHVHVDASLMASRQGLDGLKQDSMDNSIHGGTEPGFSISDGYPYSGIFVIEGFSDTLISGWGYQTSDYGTSEIDEKRLTENNLRKQGVKASKISFVYDLLIKYPGDKGFHKSTVVNEIVIPVG